MSKDYYGGGKRGSLDGVPIWWPTWWGQLGNDAEFREATKPRTAFKAPYYDGGHRMVIAGIPTRVAAHVKSWSAANKAKLYKGTQAFREGEEIRVQAIALGLVRPANDDQQQEVA